ncbi:MAG: hypothetical protein JWO31_794, partial [Phycisphaerales bacterium]|nr:hypothetical protein [Phycisphaerales bacterium]
FQASTGLKPFSPDHRRAIDRIQSCALEGGLFVQAFPRGFAKTTISENSALWAVLYGHRRFVPIFGADATSAAGNIDSIKIELSDNDLLYEDFPEVCHAVRALEGKPQRCASQTHTAECPDCPGDECPACGGQGAVTSLTHIEWTADKIVLPTIAGSAAGGAILTARGLMGGSRGMKHKQPDGTQQRPDCVLIDDPQTDDSAGTDLQVNKRLDVIRKNILKLGGHTKKLAVVMNATVIRRGDLVEQLLTPKKFPAWQGERIPMVRAWAGGVPAGGPDPKGWKDPGTHDGLWLGDYARLRTTFDPDALGDQQRAHREATAFYERNRERMDAGCVVAWEHCYDPATELSAVQHAYNSLIDDGEEVFASECQNAPLDKNAGPGHLSLSADAIAGRLSRVARGTVPNDASRLVVFVDVQMDLLFWTACAFADDFTGYVVDYGPWPEQSKPYFAAKDARPTMRKKTGADSLEAWLYAGLDALVGELMARDWRRENGVRVKPERILVDAGWGKSTETVDKFCGRSAHASVLFPSHGAYVGAKSRVLNASAPKPGERRGKDWQLTHAPGRRFQRFVRFDANSWKTFVYSRLNTPVGGRGALALYGADAKAHRLFADHAVSEYGTEVTANGRTITEWGIRPGRPDNHFLDCLVGCHVAASMLGCDPLKSSAPAPRPARPKRQAVTEW